MSTVLSKSRSIAVLAAILCGVFGSVFFSAQEAPEAQAIGTPGSVSCPSGTTWKVFGYDHDGRPMAACSK